MKIQPILCTGIAAVMLAGCSTGRGPELNEFNRHFLKTQRCSGASCALTVTVTENAPTGTCSATVDDSVLDLSQGQADKSIAWTINDGYKFSTESFKYAIVIKTDPKGAFKNANVQAAGRRAVLQYTRGGGGNSYTYGLNFQRDNGTYCEMLDPYMVD
jgi:hypothetical protein